MFRVSPTQYTIPYIYNINNPRQPRILILSPTSDIDPLANPGNIEQAAVAARSQQTVAYSIIAQSEQSYVIPVTYTLTFPGADSSTLHLVDLVFRGVCPKFAVSNVQSAGVSKGTLWAQLGLVQLNRRLGSCPDDADHTVVDMHFGAALVGSADYVITLRLSNVGLCAAEWGLLFPNDIVHQAELWAENTAPSDEEVHQRVILDKKIFTAEPRTGFLEPGSSVIVTVIFRHLLVNNYCLPVYFMLSNGVKISLNFLGTTIPRGVPYVFIPANEHELQPVPITSTSPPVQHYTLRNVGEVLAHFSLDLSAVRDLRVSCFDFPVLDFGVEAGTIPPGGTVIIPLRFRPLQGIDYTVAVPLLVEGQVHRVITFKGRGLQTNESLPFPVSDVVPPYSLTDIGGQNLRLSEERLYFEDIPTHSRSHRGVVLTNTCPFGHSVSFVWCLKEFDAVLAVSPMSGILLGGESMLCRFTFTATDGPRIYDFDVTCMMRDETDTSMNGKEGTESELVDGDGAGGKKNVLPGLLKIASEKVTKYQVNSCTTDLFFFFFFLFPPLPSHRLTCMILTFFLPPFLFI